MDFIEIKCSDGKGLRLRIKEKVYEGPSRYQHIAVYDTEEFGRCLFLDGVIQSSDRDHELYDREILKKLRPSDRDILVLGGGDGFIAKEALKLNPEVKVTIVDLDDSVVHVCEKYLLQEPLKKAGIEVVIRDALDYIRNVEDESLDGIISDLTDFPVGYDRKMGELFSNIFELATRKLRAGGWISLYGGVKGLVDDEGHEVIDLLSEGLRQYFSCTEYSEVFIPSFGEPCYFLYGLKNDYSYRNATMGS